MKLLETKDLLKKYSGRAVVDHVSFVVRQGEIVGLLGRNGAGKTTSFRMTIGMIRPDAGSVFFDGVDVTQMPMYKRARSGMGYLSQEPSIFQRLTVRQNIFAILETMKLSRADRKHRCDQLLEQFGLSVVSHQPARTLSGGERRKLEIARALVTNPTMILLDEPFSGVDPIAVEDLQREIRGCHIFPTEDLHCPPVSAQARLRENKYLMIWVRADEHSQETCLFQFLVSPACYVIALAP